MQGHSAKPVAPAPMRPTRPAALQPPQRTTLPTRVLESSRAPQQLCFQFHR